MSASALPPSTPTAWTVAAQSRAWLPARNRVGLARRPPREQHPRPAVDPVGDPAGAVREAGRLPRQRFGPLVQRAEPAGELARTVGEVVARWPGARSPWRDARRRRPAVAPDRSRVAPRRAVETVREGARAVRERGGALAEPGGAVREPVRAVLGPAERRLELAGLRVHPLDERGRDPLVQPRGRDVTDPVAQQADEGAGACRCCAP